jgi:hypothetical protein
MDTHRLIVRLEAEWDRSQGFLGRLRTGEFDPAGFERFEQLLRSVNLGDEETIDRRLVSLLWFVPLFMTWQRERVAEQGGDPDQVEAATQKITDILLRDVLGAP